jgi:hypothetical protein
VVVSWKEGVVIDARKMFGRVITDFRHRNKPSGNRIHKVSPPFEISILTKSRNKIPVKISDYTVYKSKEQ